MLGERRATVEEVEVSCVWKRESQRVACERKRGVWGGRKRTI